MSFPIYPEKYKLPALVTAEQMIEFRRRHSGLGNLRAPESVVLCLYNGVIKRLAWRYAARRVTAFQCDLYLLKRINGKVGVAGNFGMGAPALTALAEQMIAWGSTRLIILSLAGGMQSDLIPGSIVIGDRAIRDEGTSYHYLPPAEEVSADMALVASISKALENQGLSYSIGTTWSTDAAYRETSEEARYFQNKGVKTVDMESAGLFAVGQVRQVPTASVFVVGDSLSGTRWDVPNDMRSLHLRFKKLLDVLIRLLNDL